MVSQYREITAFLEAGGIPDADFDARCMIEQVTGQKLETVQHISDHQQQELHKMAERRICGEPLQYILGEWEFFGMRLFVGEGVLIPRPDTEVLVETVLHHCKGRTSLRILDLCTGSGCIALALQKHLPDAEIHALDISEAALAYAVQNAEYHALPVQFHRVDVLHGTLPGQFDVIVSNPPYLTTEEMAHLQTEIRCEPAGALEAGTDGLQFYRGITARWNDSLRDGGLLAYEIGEQQGEAVRTILESGGFRNIQILQDYARRDRVVTGIR